jgi:hypothetical protein
VHTYGQLTIMLRVGKVDIMWSLLKGAYVRLVDKDNYLSLNYGKNWIFPIFKFCSIFWKLSCGIIAPSPRTRFQTFSFPIGHREKRGTWRQGTKRERELFSKISFIAPYWFICSGRYLAGALDLRAPRRGASSRTPPSTALRSCLLNILFVAGR